MVARPSAFITWTDGSNAKMLQPPSAVAAQGFVAGQPVPYQYMNWLLYTLDQWCQYLDGRAGGGGSTAQAANNMRLLGGGNWSAVGTTLQWDAPFNIAVPGQTDASNAAATGGVTLADGQVAYVNVNVPFSYTATTTNGSTSLSNLSSTSGLVSGMAVSGAGIPANTTITVSGSTVTLSNAATVTGNGVSVTFQSSGTLTVATAAESALSAGPQTVIFARNSGGVFIVGVGAGEMVLHSGETKTLRGNGFGASYTGTAGFAITQGQVCYVSPGGSADANRTAGSVFTADASTTSLGATPCRSRAVGIATQSVTAGQQVTLLMQGVIGGFSGLTVGGLVWLSASVSGGVTQVMPGSNPGQTVGNSNICANSIVLCGVAISATQVYVRLPASDVSVPTAAVFTSLSVGTAVMQNLFCTVAFSSPAGHRFLSQGGWFDSTQGGNTWAASGTYSTYMAGGMPWFLAPQVAGKLELLRLVQKCVGAIGAVTFKLYSYPAGSAIAGTGTLVTNGSIAAPTFTAGGAPYPAQVVVNAALVAGSLYALFINSASSVASGSSYAIGFTAQIVE